MKPPPDWSVRRRRTDNPSDRLPAEMPPAQRLLALGRQCERSGRLDEAIGAYEASIDAARNAGDDRSTLADGLRRLAVLIHRRGESERARALCWQSHEVATGSGDVVMQAEALNTLGGLELVREHLEEARRYLVQALDLAEPSPELRGRIQQNLGILYNIRGDRPMALLHYNRSLEAFLTARNEQGCAVAYNNLGMISADQKDWKAANRYFELGRRTAQHVGDDHLRATCLLNWVEVLVALRRFDEGQLAAETALSIFEELRTPAAIAEAHRVLGIVLREMGRLSLAQSRFELAVEVASETGSPVNHGEALCEVARLQARLGHTEVAIQYLSRAGDCFRQVPEALSGPEVLRGEYPNVVRVWCELVEAIDPAAAAHASRVAAVAVGIARTIGLPLEDQTTIRLAAQLHEVGMLNRADGGGSPAESGAALLEAAGCFGRVAPIVGSVESGADSGIAAQIVRLAGAYDELVHSGAERVATSGLALARLAESGQSPASLLSALEETLRRTSQAA